MVQERKMLQTSDFPDPSPSHAIGSLVANQVDKTIKNSFQPVESDQANILRNFKIRDTMRMSNHESLHLPT